MKPSLVLHPRPEQQPRLVGLAILLALSFAVPFGQASFWDLRAWMVVAATFVAAGRPLLSRIVVYDTSSVSVDDEAFPDVTALHAWGRHLGICDTGGVTIVRLRARWTAKQLGRLAATLGVPLTVHRARGFKAVTAVKAATGPRMMADLMAGGAVVAGSDVVVRDLGKHAADVSRLARILSDSPPRDANGLPRVRLRDASGNEVARAAAALLDAGALIRLESLARTPLAPG